MTDTPETDAATITQIGQLKTAVVDVQFAQRLERERNEAREELQEWKDGAYAAEHPCPDEVHCTCVPLLLSKIAALRKERDEAERENEQLLASNKTYERDWPVLVHERIRAQEVLRLASQRARVQAAAYKLKNLRDNSRWSIFNEGRAQSLEKFAEELEATK